MIHGEYIRMEGYRLWYLKNYCHGTAAKWENSQSKLYRKGGTKMNSNYFFSCFHLILLIKRHNSRERIKANESNFKVINCFVIPIRLYDHFLLFCFYLAISFSCVCFMLCTRKQSTMIVYRQWMDGWIDRSIRWEWRIQTKCEESYSWIGEAKGDTIECHLVSQSTWSKQFINRLYKIQLVEILSSVYLSLPSGFPIRFCDSFALPLYFQSFQFFFSFSPSNTNSIQYVVAAAWWMVCRSFINARRFFFFGFDHLIWDLVLI